MAPRLSDSPVAHLYMHSTDHDRMTSLQLQYEIISAFNKALALPICQACIIRVYIHSHIQHKDITSAAGDSFTLGFQAQIRWKSDLEIFRWLFPLKSIGLSMLSVGKGAYLREMLSFCILFARESVVHLHFCTRDELCVPFCVECECKLEYNTRLLIESLTTFQQLFILILHEIAIAY